MDNSCYQNWKTLYKPCIGDQSSKVVGDYSLTLPISYNYYSQVVVGPKYGWVWIWYIEPPIVNYRYNYCKTQFKGYKCYRRFLSIIGM